MTTSIRCREIIAEDVPAVVTLLTGAVGQQANHWTPHPRRYWQAALDALTAHDTPEGCPKYGYALDDDGTIVGAILVIATRVGTTIRCNLSSWFVQEPYRMYAPLLAARAVRFKSDNMTYYNLSAAPHTWPILQRHGFTPFAAGYMVALPLLSRPAWGATVCPLGELWPDATLSEAEIAILLDHVGYGCVSVVCTLRDGTRHPFVFRMDKRRNLPAAHVIYCRNLADLALCAHALGRFLLIHYRCTLLIFDANGTPAGLHGLYRPGKPKFYKGAPLVLGDVAYSEEVLFT